MSRARVALLGTLACAFAATLSAPSAAAAADPAKTIVLFVPTQLEPSTRAALEDALVTQLSLLPAQVVFAVGSETQPSVEQRIEQARAAAEANRAIGAFWLEVRPSGAWFVYAMDTQDPHDERIVIRRLEELPKSAEAAVESVALIVRATTDALVRGEPIARGPLPTAVEEPKPAPTPVVQEAPVAPQVTQVVLAPSAGSALRVAAAYVGTTFAKDFLWQNGLTVHGAWLWPAGPYLGFGYTFFPALRFRDELVEFSVERRPFALLAGLRFPTGDFTFSAELGAEVELRGRETLSWPSGIERREKVTKVLANICPKLESEYRITSWLALFVNVGLDFVLANFPYSRGDENGKTSVLLLDPFDVRLTVHAGVGIIR